MCVCTISVGLVLKPHKEVEKAQAVSFTALKCFWLPTFSECVALSTWLRDAQAGLDGET